MAAARCFCRFLVEAQVVHAARADQARGSRPEQCGHVRVWSRGHRRGDAHALLALVGLQGFLVAELDLAAHARAGGDGQGSCLDVTVDHAALQQLHTLGALDVADELAAHHHDTGFDVAFELRAHVQVTLPSTCTSPLKRPAMRARGPCRDLALDRKTIRGNVVIPSGVVAPRGRGRRRAVSGPSEATLAGSRCGTGGGRRAAAGAGPVPVFESFQSAPWVVPTLRAESYLPSALGGKCSPCRH